jgi:hypothetical protein
MKASPKNKAAVPKAKRMAARTFPAHGEIATLAFQIYLDRGAEDGRDLEDWFKAEAKLLRKSGNTQTASRTPKPKRL